jgi:hypothetical protein
MGEGYLYEDIHLSIEKMRKWENPLVKVGK